MVLAWVLLCAIMAWMPGWWLLGWREAYTDRWYMASRQKASLITQQWEHWVLRVPDFHTGHERAVQEWLERETLVTALVDASNGQVWIRDGAILRPARNAQEASIPQDWAKRAMIASPAIPRLAGVPRNQTKHQDFRAGALWWLVDHALSNWQAESDIVSFEGKWCLIKRWRPGSLEVEHWLHEGLNLSQGYRLGLFHFPITKEFRQHQDLAKFRPPPAAETSVSSQATDLNDAPFRVDPEFSRSFGSIWNCVLQMTPDVYRNFRRAYSLRQRLAWTTYALLVGASGLALGLVLFTRNREKALADRLATLAHSLKTPLALLRLRCDTALNLDLSPETQQSRILEIRSEVDRLVLRIEGGLEEMRSQYQGPAKDRIDADFFEELDADLTPAFEAEGRLLEVYAGGGSFRCCAALLRAALNTLIENALAHGAGRVKVEVAKQARSVTVTVSDEGKGIPVDRLLQMRKTKPAASARSICGSGLGLTVLAEMARQEGWGLAFAVEERGFSAVLAIPL
jgi:signal transduction histidine kinase